MLAFLQAPLFAEKVAAKSFSGEGQYEFLFIAPERKGEIEAHIARIAELEREAKFVRADLKTAEGDAAALIAKKQGKKSRRLEWSEVEGALRYSARIYDADKKLVATRTTEENSLTLELSEGNYFFQVAALTKYKTGKYSSLAAFKVTKGEPSDDIVNAEGRVETLREKLRTTERLRADHLQEIHKKALSTERSREPTGDFKIPVEAAYFVAFETEKTPPQFSAVEPLPGRAMRPQTAANGTPATTVAQAPSNFLWGAGLLAGIQDSSATINRGNTLNDYFRVAFGLEGLLRYDKAFLKYFYPQLKLQATYSAARTNVFDAMLYMNFYPGVYYPLALGKGFSALFSLSTGANIFVLLSAAASAQVLQWGVMPGAEIQYALNEKTSLYAGAMLNMTFDPNAGGGALFSGASWLKFVPFNVGLTRRF